MSSARLGMRFLRRYSSLSCRQRLTGSRLEMLLTLHGRSRQRWPRAPTPPRRRALPASTHLPSP